MWRHPRLGRRAAGSGVLSGYDDVVAMGRCPHALSLGRHQGRCVRPGPGDELQDTQDAIGIGVLGGETAMLLTLDPPEHTAYRKIVNKGFTPKMIGLIEAKVRAPGRRLPRRHRLAGRRSAPSTWSRRWPCRCRCGSSPR